MNGKQWLRILAIAIPVASILISLITSHWGFFAFCFTPAFMGWGKFWGKNNK